MTVYNIGCSVRIMGGKTHGAASTMDGGPWAVISANTNVQKDSARYPISPPRFLSLWFFLFFLFRVMIGSAFVLQSL